MIIFSQKALKVLGYFYFFIHFYDKHVYLFFFHTVKEKIVPSGACLPRPELPPLFKEHKVCSFDSGDGSYMLYVTTLEEFNHTLCEAIDLDLKGQAQVHGSS